MGSSVRLSYHRRLFVWLVAYSLLLSGSVVVFQYHREKAFKIEELNARLQLVNTYVAEALAAGRDIDSIRVTGIRGLDGLRISVVRSDGKVVYDNSLDTLPGTNHLDRREISQAILKGEGHTVRRHSQSTGDTYFYSATLADRGTVVRTALPYSLSLTQLLEADGTFLWYMCAVTVLFCLLGYFAIRKMGVHMERLRGFAARAERGEPITNVAPFPNDELGEISNHIVRLYARLQKAVEDRDREHASAMHQQREKERIKKQLTNNINHELKTPVASVRACVETLLAYPDMPEAKRREFLEKSLLNTDRLKRLLDDVALITRMDDGSDVISREPVDVGEIVREVADESAIMASAKGIKMELDIEGELPVNGNAGLLASVFQNLIDNAVAYSGGSRIRISAVGGGGGMAVIRVADNGCGVAPEHLPHLFERFYRVDKGRSRRSGGTGLGLSIVKNAVGLHHGSIRVDNGRDGGLVYTIRLPLISSTPP
ncbi:MAG: sensor histidine kinase [Muribaculaceae bacterium]|nr:sensor histidine kinase [Muribaculaceae bacterium]MDE7080634.1 sensor histidine kinase [Muribaculaceae bacterium]